MKGFGKAISKQSFVHRHLQHILIKRAIKAFAMYIFCIFTFHQGTKLFFIMSQNKVCMTNYMRTHITVSIGIDILSYTLKTEVKCE